MDIYHKNKGFIKITELFFGVISQLAMLHASKHQTRIAPFLSRESDLFPHRKVLIILYKKEKALKKR